MLLFNIMCTACGLPTTHLSTLQTISTLTLLTTGAVSFLWIYYILTRAWLRQSIRRVLDRFL